MGLYMNVQVQILLLNIGHQYFSIGREGGGHSRKMERGLHC